MIHRYKYLLLALFLMVVSSSAMAAETVDYRLPNGMRVILMENHRSPVVSMMVWVKVGSASERPGEYGLAHLMEHMLFKGTAKRGPGEIAREIEAAGGNINAYTSYDETVFYVDMASRYMAKGLDVLSDMVFDPALDPEEFAREKEVVIEEIKMGQDKPGSQLQKALFARAFKVHPYGRPVIGYDTSVKEVSRETAASFHQRWYRPDNMILVVSGDFSPEGIKPLVESLFGRAGQGRVTPRQLPAEPRQEEGRAEIIHSDVENARLALGFHIPEYASADTLALDLLAEIVGEGRSSRLYEKVKREQELVDEISAYAYTPRDPGLFVVSATLSPENLEKAIASIMAEISILGHSPASKDEIERAKLNVRSYFIRSRETMSGEARTAANFEALAGDYRAKDRYLTDLEKLTPADLVQVAEKYLKPGNMTLAVLLPEDKKTDFNAEAAIKIAVQSATPAPLLRVYTLKNGARLMVKADDSLPLVSIRAAFLGGLRYEDAMSNGLNNLLAEVWDRATTRRSAPELARAVEDMAGEISSFSGRNSFGLSAEFLNQYLDRGLELFCEVLTSPALTDEELTKAKNTVLADLKSQQESPPSLAFLALARNMYVGHPYSMNQLGTPESLERITREHLKEYYEKWARPENMIIAVVGSVEPDKVRDGLENLLSGWSGKAPAEMKIPKPRDWRGLKIVTEPMDKEQAHLVLGFPAPGLDSSDRYALEVLDKVLSGMGGRMFIELRDKQSLGYSVSSFYYPGLDVGSFGLYIAFDPDKLTSVQKGFLEVIKGVIDKPVSEKELADAKEYLLGAYEVGLQKLDAQAADMAFNELYGLGLDYHDRYIKGINEVTAEDVQKAAQKYLNLNQAVEVIVGPLPG